MGYPQADRKQCMYFNSEENMRHFSSVTCCLTKLREDTRTPTTPSPTLYMRPCCLLFRHKTTTDHSKHSVTFTKVAARGILWDGPYLSTSFRRAENTGFNASSRGHSQQNCVRKQCSSNDIMILILSLALSSKTESFICGLTVTY